MLLDKTALCAVENRMTWDASGMHPFLVRKTAQEYFVAVKVIEEDCTCHWKLHMPMAVGVPLTYSQFLLDYLSTVSTERSLDLGDRE